MEYENLEKTVISKLNIVIMPYVKIERYGQYIRCAITRLTGNGKDNNDYLAYDNIHELLFGSQYRFSLFYVMTEVWIYALPTQMINTLKFIQPSVSIEELLIKLDLYIA
jgi:hypothetical protein